MSAKHRCNRNGSEKRPHPLNPLTPAGVGLSRPALLASASLIALAALDLPGAARAACVPTPQIISGPFAGPVVSNGGAITVTGSGKISGGPDGVDALACAITTLTNQSGGTILGAAGGTGLSGGVGVSNANTITALANSGKILGGAGGKGSTLGGSGGARVSNAKGATIGSLSNATGATIVGGNGNSGIALFGGAGGDGLSNAGTITTLSNSGAISGGNGGSGSYIRAGGAGVSNARTITTLSSSAKIIGGNGGSDGKTGGAGGAGVSNFGNLVF